MYPVSFEIAGPFAMFTRFDSGIPTSYPVPTFSAVKGMFESVAQTKEAYFRPLHVEICCPVQYERYVTNYGGPYRSDSQRTKNNNAQVHATVLSEVRYRVHGLVEPMPHAKQSDAHKLQSMFVRRANQGVFHHNVPFLGMEQFLPSQFCSLDKTLPDTPDTIPIRCPMCGNNFGAETKKRQSERKREPDLLIPSLLHMTFDMYCNGVYKPSFRQNVMVREGILCFQQEAYHASGTV